MKINIKNLTISQMLVMTSFAIMIPLTIIVIIYISVSTLNSSNNQFEIQSIANSKSVIEKIDRNFYERFGDVQAFASNVLAVKTAFSDTVSSDAQEFINTMTKYYVLYDLMMITDIKGNVVATNTVDKNGKKLDNQFLIGKNFSNELWFRNCTSLEGPKGGAWYSDFKIDKISSTLNSNQGFGMAFSAPIKNKKGETIGVWYNFANWSEVTQGIRRETESELRKNIPNSFILITNNTGEIIDADDENFLMQSTLLQNNFSYNEKSINNEDFIIGKAIGKGAYTFKGKNWIVYTYIPKATFTWAYFVDQLAGLTLIILLIITFICYLFYILSKKISTNINRVNDTIGELANGKIIKIDEVKLGEMAPTIKKLVDGLESKSIFANQIGQGNLDHKFSPVSNDDVLGASLITMRNNLASLADEDKKRNWINEGLAKFGEILRANNEGIDILTDNIISNLVRYLDANQGGLFIVNDNTPEKYLELKACYAWDKKKFIEMRIEEGEGLIGQAWQENDTLYITDVPSDFVRITSGLGGANPNAFLIVPLTVNDETYGVIELASFKIFEQYQIDFVKKLAESIASTLSTAKTNERTKVLLEQSQQQTEEMRAQEEEMRQNMEEMAATQEEMHRKEMEMTQLLEQLKSQSKVENDNSIIEEE